MDEEIIEVVSDLNIDLLQNIFIVLTSIKEFLFIISCFVVLIFFTLFILKILDIY